jgi:hypothetical protein
VGFPTGKGILIGSDPLKPCAGWKGMRDESERATPTPKDTFWQRGLAWAFLFGGVFYYFAIARHVGTPEQYFLAHLKAYSLIVLPQLILFFLYRRLSNHINIGPGLKAVKAKVPSEGAVAVSVRIVQDGSLTGYDEGYVWMENQMVCFKGLQTYFHFNRDDVPPLGMWPKKLRPDPAAGKMPETILLPVNERQLVLHFTLINSLEDHGTRRITRAFHTGLWKWLQSTPESASSEATLPPVDVHPNLLRGGNWNMEGVVGGFLLASVNMALLLTAPISLSIATLPALVAVLQALAHSALIAASLRLAWLQLRDVNFRRQLFLEQQLRRQSASAASN